MSVKEVAEDTDQGKICVRPNFFYIFCVQILALQFGMKDYFFFFFKLQIIFCIDLSKVKFSILLSIVFVLSISHYYVHLKKKNSITYTSTSSIVYFTWNKDICASDDLTHTHTHSDRTEIDWVLSNSYFDVEEKIRKNKNSTNLFTFYNFFEFPFYSRYRHVRHFVCFFLFCFFLSVSNLYACSSSR